MTAAAGLELAAEVAYAHAGAILIPSTTSMGRSSRSVELASSNVLVHDRVLVSARGWQMQPLIRAC